MCTAHGQDGATESDVLLRSAQSRIGRRGLILGAGAVGLGVVGAAIGTQPASAAVTSQNGWPAAKNLPTTRVEVGAAAISFANGAPATILGFVAREFNSKVEALRKADTGGFNFRKIAGSNTYSNHASGTAIDANWNAHPQGSRGTFSAAQVDAIRGILAYCGPVVRWGGDYSGGSVDEMHFELNAGPSDPAVAALVSKIGGTPPPPGSGQPTIKQGSKGEAVKTAQAALNKKGSYGLVVDGDFGAKTKAAAVDFQKKNGLVADGIIGPKTWAKLLG